MFIATPNWILVLPTFKLIRVRKSGIDTALLHGDKEQKVLDLQARLRYKDHMHIQDKARLEDQVKELRADLDKLLDKLLDKEKK